MSDDERLKWKKTSEELVCHTPVYDIYRQHEIAAEGIEGDYYVTKADDWAVIIPVIDDDFIMVRQWRHGSQSITLEFPGGICDSGEKPLESAARELEEETGYRPGRVVHLGSFSPNPALFSNRVHCYLAEDLVDTKHKNLDEDEVLDHLRVPIKDVIGMMGESEFDHALMASAMALYLIKK